MECDRLTNEWLLIIFRVVQPAARDMDLPFSLQSDNGLWFRYERRPGGWYWYACKRIGGNVKRFYCGKYLTSDIIQNARAWASGLSTVISGICTSDRGDTQTGTYRLKPSC